MTTSTQKTANFALISGVLIMLSIGVLYAWSVIKKNLIINWDWSSSEAGLPYTLAIVFMALGVFIGGRIQDKIGPKWVLTCGGTLAGFGMIFSGLVGNSPTGVAIGFGVITGIGMGFAYACSSPPALKWFHPSKKGMVTGFIIGGFGMAAIYLAPLASALLSRFSIETTLMILGVVPIIVCVPIAQFIKNPPAGYVPEAPKNLKKTAVKIAPATDFTLSEMIKTKRFYMLFFMFLFSSSAGLMILGNMPKIANLQVGITDTTLLAGLVAFLAFTNTFGRVLGGVMSDKIGPINAIFVVFVLQMLNMIGFIYYGSLAMLIVGIILIGFTFGTILSVFPAITAGQYGLKNFGANYGLMFIAWGLSGAVAPVIADYFYDIHKNFNTAYLLCAMVMVVLIFVNYLLKRNLTKIKN